MAISTDLGPLALGESVAVNGACLTVAALGAGGFEADVSAETVARTTLGGLSGGDRVNLERALAVGDRLGGHFVSGHVDGVAVVAAASREGETTRAVVELPEGLLRFVAEKGSIAVDGVSLTVNRVEKRRIELLLIPHTLSATTLGSLSAGQRLNVEVDLVARHVVRYLEALGAPSADAGLQGALRKAGFLG